MPRPMEFDRHEAVEAALDQIWKCGFSAASVNSLSQTLNINRSSFYNTFDSRENLFKEVMQVYASMPPNTALYEMTPESSIKEVLTTMFRDICRIRSSDPEHRGCLAANSIAELTSDDDEHSEFMTALMNGIRLTIEERIEWAICSGELPEGTDKRTMALAIHNLMMGINIQSKIVYDEKALWSAASTVLKGLGLLKE